MSRALDGYQAYKYNKEKKAKRQGKSTEVTKIYDSDMPGYKAQPTTPLEAYKQERGLGTLTDAGRAAYANRAVKINPFDSIPNRSAGAQALWDLSQQGITQRKNVTDPADTYKTLPASSLQQINGLPGVVQRKRIEEYNASKAAPKGMGSFDDMAAAITADKEKREKAAQEALDMRPSYMKQQGKNIVTPDQVEYDSLVNAYDSATGKKTAKPYSEYLKDISSGRNASEQTFADAVEKGRRDTRNELDLTDAEQVQAALGGGQRAGAQETTAMLTDQEKQNFYYLAGTQGKNEAENYRQYVIQNRGLNEQIAKRNQEAIAREMSYQTPTDRFLFESGTQFLLGAGGALENMSRVPAALTGDTSYRAEGVGQHLSQDMVDSIDTSNLAGKAYKTWQQLMNTSGNNAVSIAGGVAFGPGVGSALFAAQAAGDAYQQVINEGGTVQEAQFFAGMQAIDEEVTNALLGGIAARGGGLLKNVLGNTAAARTVQNAMKGMFTNNPVGLRIANGVLDALANGGSEALQEYVQYFSEKFEKWLATGEAPTFNVDGKPMTWNQIVEAKGSAAWDVFANPEALESAFMGFLNAGMMNGIGSAARTADAWNRGGRLSQDSYQTVLDMVDPNITHYRSEDTYRAGKEAVELARDQGRRVESGQGDSIMSRYGRGLMSQAAEEYQRQYAKNETANRTYYNPDQVKALIAENDRKNRALQRLAFGGETAVDKLNRIRSELAGDTAEAAWEAPQEDHGVREVTIPAEMHEQYTQDMLNRGSADRLEWEGDSGEMVSLQREDDGYYTFTNERGEEITLDPDEASDLLPSGQPITMYDNAGSNAVETVGSSATPWGQNGTAAPSTVAQAPSTAVAAQTTAPSTARTTAAPTVSQVSPNTAPTEGVAISQQGTAASGTDRLAQLADEAGRQTVEQREAQRNAIYQAGKNRDSNFQTVMDGATMLSEAEKTAAFNQGMQDSLNEVRMEGQNNGRTEEGNSVSGEGSGRNVSLRAGEQAAGVQQTAGGTAETGNGRGVLGEADGGSLGEGSGRVDAGRTGVAPERNRGFRNREIVRVLERAADKEVRNATADMIETGEIAPARDLLRTAVPGQTLIPVFGGKTYSLRKTDAMVRAYDKNIMLTPFISSGEIMVGGGESSRAFADPVRRQLGFRLNDEEATGIQLTKHELIEFGIMDGKVNVDQAFNVISSVIPQRYIDAIVGEYFSSSTKGMSLTADETENAFRHAMKEMICDIGAGIDQISGMIKDEKARRLFEVVHERANKALTSYLNERLNNAFEAEPAAETAETSEERVELTKEAMTDGVASDGITMEGEDSIQLSEKLYKESGRDFLRKWLAEQEDISQEDKDDIVAQVDHIYDIMQQIKEEASEEGISGYRAWAEVAERNGRLTVITPNGEYPLNIDFATVCKKRKALDFVLNTMITDGDLDAQKLAGADIVRLQNLIKDEGFEIACALCFVDSKRYRIGKWADSIVNGEVKKDGKKYGYNELVRSLVPEGSKLKIDQFNYTGRDVKQPRGRLLKNASDSQLDFTLIDKVIAENKPGSWNRNLATAIKEHPELRSLLNSAELLSSVGFDPIKVKNPALFDIINNAGGSSKPKLSFSEVPYLNDILMSDAMTPEAAYAVGGVRIQSFSDFMANMVFDYVQMVSELQAKKLPAHAYTKEAAFVAMFGKTGIKINMSLVPKATTWSKAKLDAYLKTFKTKKERDKALAKLKNMAGLDAQGNYIWEDESFPYAVAMKFQADPEYAKNCGTIAVGVSDRHIKKLLMDPTIQMVIPYHKSGINPVVAKMRGIDLYNDYTNQQNTRYKKSGRKIAASANTFDFYGTLQETGDPRATAEAYLAWCKENDFIPKFQKFAKDPETRPYYYKLLADFRLYDDTGAYAPQGAVKGNYPDNMKDLILNGYSFTDKDGTEYHNGGLLDAQRVSDALRAKTREIINRYNSGEKVQNSSKLGSEEIDLRSATESDEDSLQTKINTSMTMDQAKQMVQMAFNIGDIKAWFDGEYKNGDEWLAGEGSRAVALVIDNDYSLQQKYINKVQGILDDEFTIEDVLDAYSNQSLTGAVKEKKSYDVDLSKSAGYKDNRFYAPKAPAVTAETLNTANLRATAANKDQVNKARLDILIAAHNDANIADKLGITKTELNKKLRTWSRYSARAMSLAEKLNNGVALENQWSGLQNCSIISQMNVTDDDINSMVKSITGTSRGNERNYIAKTILAADTHIDWSWLNFEFKAGRAVENSANVRGLFGNDNIIIGGNGYLNTVAHEMGHALSNKWASDLMGTEPGHGTDLADHLYNESYIKDPDAKRFAKHFETFMDSLTDVNDIRSEYTNRPGEVFARFFAKFVEWTNKTAGNYFFSENEYYKDQFKPSQYTEFVKLLQEKAALDAKQAVAEKTSTPEVETAADDPNNTNVIRQGSDQDIQYSSKLFDKGVDERLKVRMATLFSGAGTVDFALRSIVNHEFAVEFKDKIAAVYRANNGGTMYVKDIQTVNVDPHKGRVEYLHISPVCTDYSNANNKQGERDIDLKTAEAAARIIDELQPKVVTVENVRRYKNSRAVQIIEEALERNGYLHDKKVYRASEFGGATIRERMFIRAVKDGVLPKVDTSEYTPLTWYDAVKDMIPKLPPAELSNYMRRRLGVSGIDLDNLKQPVFVLGGEKSGELTFATADKPAPTILAKSTEAKILMPDGRILRATPRVMARIQGLPDEFDLGLKNDYDMEESRGNVTNAYRVVGNGVPVQLTQGIVGPLLEENLIKQKSETTGIKYSSKLQGEIDEQYDAALKSNDMDAAAKLVKEAAEKAGYTEDIYHGTRSFGFTKFNLDKMADGISIFTTSDRNLAETYSGETRREKISERAGENEDAVIDRIDGMKDEDLLPLIKEHLDSKYEQVSKKRLQEMRKERVDDIRQYADKIMDFLNDNEDSLDEKAKIAASRLASSMYKVSRSKTVDDVTEYQRDYFDDAFELKVIDPNAYYDMFDDIRGASAADRAINELRKLLESDVMFTNGERRPGSTLDVFPPNEARNLLIGELSKGVYHLYGKNENMLEFNADGDNWNSIRTFGIENKAWHVKNSKWDGYILSYNDAQTLAARITRELNGEDDYLDVKDKRNELEEITSYVFSSHKTKKKIMELESMLPARAMTRDIAKYAKTVGYDGVIIRNLKDSGGETPYNHPGDVYIYFNSSAVKSADTVTYNDDGEVIPLNERFWDSKEDIRYSSKIETIHAAQEYLTEVYEENPYSEKALAREYETDAVQYSSRILTKDEEPKHWVIGYKLFRVDRTQKGNIFPLFVGANEATPIGGYIAAEDTQSVKVLGKYKGKGENKVFEEDRQTRVLGRVGASYVLDPSQFEEWESGKTFDPSDRVQYKGKVYRISGSMSAITKSEYAAEEKRDKAEIARIRKENGWKASDPKAKALENEYKDRRDHKYKDRFIANMPPDQKGSGFTYAPTATTLAYRPGWHSGDAPYLTHIGVSANPNDSAPTHYNADHVWALCLIPADEDYQGAANREGTDENGKFVPKYADLEYIPTGGFYGYKTNSNMTGEWLISGSVKVLNVLTDEQTREILAREFADRGLVQRKRMDAATRQEVGDIDLDALGLSQYVYDGDINEYISELREQGGNIEEGPDGRYIFPEGTIQHSSSLSKEDYAPTFYSKLQREIQNYKGEKIGTASVESYLKGKGVKDEEIKWSGIRTFLEGKKSVNKQELMQFLRDNEMEIEQTILDDNPVFVGPDVDGKERTFRSIEEIQKLYADKYGEDVLMNEDYDDYMERYSFSIDDEDYSFSKESSGDNETHWEGYRLDGGENYREILFRIPGSNYSNQAMSTHWNESGVLAHARVQDFETEDGGKVLFVEEIQSDWHNAGQKKGYYDLRSINKLREEKNKTEAAFNEHGVTAMQELTDYLKKIGYDRGAKVAAYDFAGSKAALDDMKADGEYSKELINAVEKAQKYYLPYKQANDAYNDAYQDYYKTNVPDAPFRTTYTDFVLKNLLRMAAEGDYDYLAWTTGKMQEERWSDEFAEGYRIEYDQQIPKFLKKYGKQWGAGLSTISIGTGVNFDGLKQHVEQEGRVFKLVDDASGNVIASVTQDAFNKPGNEAEAMDRFRSMEIGTPVPAIVVNNAMKNSVLTEGQPMYSTKNTGEIDEKALDPRRVFISYNPDLQNAVREISDVLTAYQELAPTQAEIKRTTRQIAKKFGSHIDVELAARKMETLYNFLAGGGKPDGREVLEISMDIANDILDEATHNDPEIEKRWKKFKQEMRKRWIYVPKDRVRDLNPDGIKALRKQWKGKMVFTTDEKYRERYGQIHYIELQQMFPEYFTKNADNMNDIEAIEEIMFAFDANAPIYEQIYTGATRDEAALEIAYDIMQGYFGNDRAKDRFKKIYRDYVKPIKDRAIDEYRDKLRSIELKDAAAVEQRSVFDQIKGMKGSYVVNEKALKDVDYQGRQAMMERLREKAEQDKQRYEEQIEKVKAGYVERSQKDRLMRLAKELRAMKGGPEFEAKKKELIGDLDLIAKGISYNYERKLMDMKEEYERLAEEDENFEPDRATIKKIERLQKKQINQMTSYEITALTEAILKMKQDQWTHNRMIRETDAALVADEGRRIVNETNALKGTKGMNRLADAIDGYSLAHLNSKRAFRKMSGYNDKSGLMKLWNELNEGQHKTMDFRRRAVSPFDAFMSEEENKDFITGMFDPTVEITSSKIEIEDENGNIVRTHEPQTVKITPAMKISIYLHSLNQDNREHARYGGFRIPNMDKYERGDYSNAYGQGSKIVRLTRSDMQSIASTMTPQELRFADLAHEYFNKTSKEAINEASMLLNGYELASVDNYMPIKTDPNFTKKDISGLIQDGTIEGQGWTKDRNFMAKNPILLEDITQVLQRSIDGAALYYGLAIPVRNFNKVYEFQRSGYTDSVKEAIMQTFGKRGNEYIEKLLRDLQGGNMDTKDAAGKWVDRFTSGLRGNYAQAILTLNPSVAIKQAASYPTAAARLGFEPLKKALAKLTTSTKEDMDLINKYTPLLWYRAQGQSSDALAEVSKRKEAWQYKGGVEKTRQMFNWIQNIDVKTVKTLWYASEYYVQDNMPSFKEGTEAYYREVAKVFNEVVEDTQPNYTTMQRASISRVDNEIMKAVFMFKTQPLQNVGILYDSIMEYQAKQEAFKQAVKNGFEGDALNEYAADMAFARQGMMRSVASITVSTLVFSAMTQLAKLLLHRVDPMRDEETAELTKASILKNFFGNAAESVAGMLAGAGEIYSLIMAMTTGSYLDNLSVSGIDSLNDTMTKMLKTYQNIGKIWEDEEATPRQKTAASIVASRDLTIQIMDLTGIPANNAKKIAEALINHYHDVINPIFTGRPIDTNLESGARITDKQYANRALKYYQRNDIAKGDKAAAKIEKASAMQSVLGAQGKKDEKGNSISNSKKYDAIHRILRTPGSDEAHGKMFAAAYPSDELARYMYGGGSAFDFMQGQMLAEEIADLSEDERRKKLYSFVEETGYTLEQKKAWLVSDKDRIESKTLTAWRDANGTDWDYIKHMSNLEKFNGSKNKKEKVVAYIKRQTTDTKKRKALFLMAGYQLDSKEDGKTVKDGNFKKAMEN